MIVQGRLTHRTRRGFVLADVIAGIVLLVAVASLLAVSVHRFYAASDRLANARNATRLAEDALARLQTHQPPTTDSADRSVRIDDLDCAAPPSQRWVQVTATVQRRTVTLTGLVPKPGKPQ